MNTIEKGAYALASTALLTGASAWVMNQTGLAKKVMRTAAPSFIDASKYGLVRGGVYFGILTFSLYLQKSVKGDWTRMTVRIGTAAALVFSVPYTVQFAKKHLSAKVPEQFIYLAVLVEGASFMLTHFK